MIALEDGKSLRLKNSKSEKDASVINPWLIILFTAPLPIALLLIFFFQWYQQRTDYSRVTSQFVQRQNMILAYDAMEVSRKLSGILEAVVRDVKTLSLIMQSEKNYIRFYEAHFSNITRYQGQGAVPEHVPFPLYTELISLNSQGQEVIRVVNGQVERVKRTRNECLQDPMCDGNFVDRLLKMAPGEVLLNKMLKWYSPEGGPDHETGGVLKVGYRVGGGGFILGVAYRQIKEILYYPAFPYQMKNDLLEAYYAGNYIYVVDADYDFLAHPKHWHVVGIDRHSGKSVAPVKVDSDEGTHPLNVKAYKGEKLKEYFDRLLTKSFTQGSIDIFRAPNLQGTIRVLSVAPILFSKGQFQKTGIFGHVITGCNVDFFEEPRERLVPYY